MNEWHWLIQWRHPALSESQQQHKMAQLQRWEVVRLGLGLPVIRKSLSALCVWWWCYLSKSCRCWFIHSSLHWWRDPDVGFWAEYYYPPYVFVTLWKLIKVFVLVSYHVINVDFSEVFAKWNQVNSEGNYTKTIIIKKWKIWIPLPYPPSVRTQTQGSGS